MLTPRLGGLKNSAKCLITSASLAPASSFVLVVVASLYFSFLSKYSFLIKSQIEKSTYRFLRNELKWNNIVNITSKAKINISEKNETKTTNNKKNNETEKTTTKQKNNSVNITYRSYYLKG